jgi:hypothetical protein
MAGNISQRRMSERVSICQRWHGRKLKSISGCGNNGFSSMTMKEMAKAGWRRNGNGNINQSEIMAIMCIWRKCGVMK